MMDNAGDAFVLTEQARSPSKPNYNPEEAEARLLKLFHQRPRPQSDKAKILPHSAKTKDPSDTPGLWVSSCVCLHAFRALPCLLLPFSNGPVHSESRCKNSITATMLLVDWVVASNTNARTRRSTKDPPLPRLAPASLGPLHHQHLLPVHPDTIHPFLRFPPSQSPVMEPDCSDPEP